MIFRCRVCDERLRRIDDLKDQIRSLQTLVMPAHRADVASPDIVDANRQLGGSEETPPPVSLTSDQKREAEDITREAMALLTGNYE